MKYKYLYGPIPSRRLGVSLGVDPIPHKTCPLNCIYCECGATNQFTIERKAYISTEILIKELDHFMLKNRKPDFVTFSGSGEPTLYSDLGHIIQYIHQNYPGVRVAVVTNSVMFFSQDVRSDLIHADIVLPSLDAVSPDIYRKIDLPMASLKIEDNPFFLQTFAKEFLLYADKELWVEIFIVEGLNDHESELEKFVSVFMEMPFTKIHLNRLDRVGTQTNLSSSSMLAMRKVKTYLEKRGVNPVEIVGKCKNRQEIALYKPSLEEAIINNLKRRSMSFEDLLLIADKQTNIEEYLDYLLEKKIISHHILEGNILYRYLRS